MQEIADVQGLRFTNFSRPSHGRIILGVEYSGIPDALSADVSWEWIREFEQALEEVPYDRSRVRLRQPSAGRISSTKLSFNVIAFQFGNLVHLVHPSELDSITIGLMV